jgi:iron complex transport system permease protein
MLIIDSKKLNILLLGDSEAEYLGINIKALKKRIIICTVLSVGVSVSISGIIGFVGLVVPHLIRLTFGSDNRWLIPLSALLGALLLLIADTFARTIVSPAELPVGIITSLIGGPFFLWLLVKQYSNKFTV